MPLKPSDGGMPSSHAMSLGFIATFTALQLPSTMIPLVLYTAVSLVYRVQAKLHTWEQIAVGLVVGASTGFSWWHLVTGENPWGVHIMTLMADTVLDENGRLPWPALAVPALVGAAVVGSFERRISRWLKSKSE